MKKTLTLLIVFVLSYQLVDAQTNPALLTNFNIDRIAGTSYSLSWNIANNEVVGKFDVEKSTNGIDFTTIGVLSSSQKRGSEIYKYNEEATNNTVAMYRLKMTSSGRDIYYSKIVILSPKRDTDSKISILGNPVKDKLIIRFSEFQSQSLDIKIYDLTGRNVYHATISKVDRSNIISIPINMLTNSGIYIAEVNNGIERLTSKFIKQ